MHHIELITTFTYGLGAAVALGYVTHRLGLSPIVGYLLAGVAVGPHTPGFVANENIAKQMAEIGVILLMFGVGLHFHFDELLAVRGVAVPGAVVQSVVATVCGALVAVAFGWGWTVGLVFGLALSVASTVVLTRVLADANELHTPTGHVAVGWLVVEDLFTVVVLVLLPPLLGDGGEGGVGVALGLAALKLGAFLAGMVVGRSEFSVRAATDALPMRDAFAVLFFVSVGMLFDPRFLLDSPLVVLATVLVVMVAKPVAAAAIVLLLGRPVRQAFAVAVALGQIGEFSFILAGVAAEYLKEQFPPAVTSALVAAAIVSISANPLLYRLIGPAERWAAKRPKLWKRLTSRVRGPLPAAEVIPDIDPAYRAVVIGYGPVGRTVCRLLKGNGIEPTVVELNIDTVTRLRADGVSVVYGDAAHLDTLKQAGVDRAASLILSSSGMAGSAEVIGLARKLNPEVRVLARSAYVRELGELREAGAEAVYSGEGEVALALTEDILRRLGATPEQIDRERERVRTDLFGAVVVAPEPPASVEPPKPA